MSVCHGGEDFADVLQGSNSISALEMGAACSYESFFLYLHDVRSQETDSYNRPVSFTTYVMILRSEYETWSYLKKKASIWKQYQMNLKKNIWD